MIKAIIGLTAAYVTGIAIGFTSPLNSSGSTIDNVVFAEGAFATPVLIACFLTFVLKRPTARRDLLIFDVAYTTLTVLVFVGTFFGNHDAQYQLTLLLVPVIGFPAVAIAGVGTASQRVSRSK